MPNLPSWSSLAKDRLLSGPRAGVAQRLPLHHRMFGILPARRAQNINARVRKNVPEESERLKKKAGCGCDNRVDERESLWTALEKTGETVGRSGRDVLSLRQIVHPGVSE